MHGRRCSALTWIRRAGVASALLVDVPAGTSTVSLEFHVPYGQALRVVFWVAVAAMAALFALPGRTPRARTWARPGPDCG